MVRNLVSVFPQKLHTIKGEQNNTHTHTHSRFHPPSHANRHIVIQEVSLLACLSLGRVLSAPTL